MWEAIEPVYRKGKFYSKGDIFDAPETAVISLLAQGIVKRVPEENHGQATPESTPSVVEAPVASPKEQTVEAQAEKAPIKPVKKHAASHKASPENS